MCDTRPRVRACDWHDKARVALLVKSRSGLGRITTQIICFVLLCYHVYYIGITAGPRV